MTPFCASFHVCWLCSILCWGIVGREQKVKGCRISCNTGSDNMWLQGLIQDWQYTHPGSTTKSIHNVLFRSNSYEPGFSFLSLFLHFFIYQNYYQTVTTRQNDDFHVGNQYLKTTQFQNIAFHDISRNSYFLEYPFCLHEGINGRSEHGSK